MPIYLFIAIVIAFISLMVVIIKILNNKTQTENYKLLSKIEYLLEENNKLSLQNRELQELYNKEVEIKFLAEQKAALATQKYESLEDKFKDWEEQKQKSMEHAKAAIFDTGYKLSNQLIAEHKRESENQKEEAQKQFKIYSENLQKDFSSLTQIVSGLKEQVTISQNSTDLVHKALLSPNSVGSLAELTLENILKSSNLIANIDYHIQYSMMDQDNNRLRPDAIVFLPGNNLLVIDSKASKFFLELAGAKNEIEENEIKIKLKNTMRTHLKNLSSKDYKQAISSHLNKKQQINHISTIMFLPTETSLEKLHDIDNQLINDAWQSNIFPAGPVGLVNILSHAKFQINEEQKNENYHEIINEVSSLLYNIANLAGHAKKLGHSIYNSIGYFDKFAASFNSNLISKSKRIEKLGVAIKTNKQMPDMLERYQVISGNKLTMIEGETQEDVKDE